MPPAPLPRPILGPKSDAAVKDVAGGKLVSLFAKILEWLFYFYPTHSDLSAPFYSEMFFKRWSFLFVTAPAMRIK